MENSELASGELGRIFKKSNPDGGPDGNPALKIPQFS
jgi:hypothetical protein